MKVFSFKNYIKDMRDNGYGDIVLKSLELNGLNHWAINADGWSVETLESTYGYQIDEKWTEEVSE